LGRSSATREVDLHAAVLRLADAVGGLNERTALTERFAGDHATRDALADQVIADRSSAALREALVVAVRTRLVGVAGERDRSGLAPADASIDLRLLTIKPDSIKPDSIEGPLPDDSTRPQGVACTIDAWRPAAWYPHAKPDLRLTLTEFPDPAGEAIYFNVPDPSAAEFVDDEVMGTDSPLGSP